MDQTRRGLLLGGSALATAGLAGCLGDLGRDDPEQGGQSGQDVYTSFFTLYEFTRHVIGDADSVDNAVPSGQHGHEWEPPMEVLPTVVESDAFVYLETEGFQPWVDDALERIEADHADDVTLIDASAGIELLEYGEGGHGHSHGDGHGHGNDHSHDHATETDDTISVAAIDLLEADTGERVADAHGDHWHDTPLEVAVDGSLALAVRLEDDAGDEIDLAAAGSELATTVRHGSEFVTLETAGDTLTVDGEAAGDATVVVQVLEGEDSTVGWASPALEVRVGEGGDGSDGSDGGEESGNDDGHAHEHDNGHAHEHDDSGDDHEHDDSDDHDHDHTHGEYDAKFFADPVLAQEGVKNVRDGLIALDPANEAVYEENAAAYIEDLEALHERYRDTLADREHDHVVLAGHDSFQYLAERYGFEIHTPVGLSPDDEPSGAEIAAAVDFVEEHGLEYVCWDYFDGPDVAETIVAEAETATDTVMVSPAESVVEEWYEAGYGDYIGQMREINLPAFRKALGVE